MNDIDFTRIGHLYIIDWYLCSKNQKKEKENKKYIDLFYYPFSSKKICNKQWFRMWKRIIIILPCGRLFGIISKISKKFPNHHRCESELLNIDWLKNPRDFVIPVLNQEKHFLFFTDKESKYGEKKIKEMGISQDCEYICFHARDSSYTKNLNPRRNWDYHNYRDSNIDNYISAARKLAEKGYFVLRMGAVVEKKISNAHRRVIDYASGPFQGDFLDIYLGATCKFFIISDSGIAIVPELFQRPMVYVNWVPISDLSFWVRFALFIPKKFYSKTKKRPLTFKEIISANLGECYRSKYFIDQNIQLIENTPQEICDISEEMELRLNNNFQTTDEDEMLQRKFWEIVIGEKVKSQDFRIGTKFLRENKQLLL